MNISTKLIFVVSGFFLPVCAMDLMLLYSGLKQKDGYVRGSVFAYDGNEEIGYINFFISSVNGVNGLDITRLTVYKGFRRQGVGTHLVKKVEKIAYLNKCRSIELLPLSDSEEFWRWLQYAPIAETIFYEKLLDSVQGQQVAT